MSKESSLGRLISISSNAIFRESPAGVGLVEDHGELGGLLAQKNGFYAFESALHVFPSGLSSGPHVSIERWNSDGLWRASYGKIDPGVVFFAEDIFGGQFALFEGVVNIFNPETAELSYLADGIESWAEAMLARYNYLAGYSVGHEWQLSNGALLPGHRLAARIPFIAGGDYVASNMIPVESAAMLRYWADFEDRISNLADGVRLRFDPAAVEGLKCAKWSDPDLATCRCFDHYIEN